MPEKCCNIVKARNNYISKAKKFRTLTKNQTQRPLKKHRFPKTDKNLTNWVLKYEQNASGCNWITDSSLSEACALIFLSLSLKESSQSCKSLKIPWKSWKNNPKREWIKCSEWKLLNLIFLFIIVLWMCAYLPVEAKHNFKKTIHIRE